MIKEYLTKAIALATLSVSIIIFSPVGASARVTQNEAKDSIFKNGKIYNNIEVNPTFIEEVSKATPPKGLIEKGIYALTESDENLYYFRSFGTHYYVGVDTGKIYAFESGSGAGNFNWIDNNKIVKKWFWERNEIKKDEKFTGGYQLKGWILGYDNNWYCYNSDGVIQTGWISYNGGWYYCYSNGQMAHDTTIDGYKLGSNGAWINLITASEARQLILKEDGNYLSKITDNYTRLSTNYIEYDIADMPTGTGWDVPKEPCYQFYIEFYLTSGGDATNLCEYLVGKKSKNIYIVPQQKCLPAYQIKNNQKVQTYKSLDEKTLYEWR